MQRFHSFLPQVITVAHKPDRRIISFLTEPKSPTLLYGGIEVLPGDIIVNRCDVVHKRFDPDIRNGGMFLPINEFNATVKAITGREFPEKPQNSIIRPDPGLVSRLLSLHKAVGQLAHDTPDILELPEVGRALEEQLIHLMVRCLAESALTEITTGGRRHQAIMGRLDEFFAAHPNRPIYLTEICAGWCRRADASRCLRRTTRNGPDTLSHLAPHAPRAARPPSYGPVQGYRHRHCHRSRLLGAWSFFGSLPRTVRRTSLGDVAAPRRTCNHQAQPTVIPFSDRAFRARELAFWASST